VVAAGTLEAISGVGLTAPPFTPDCRNGLGAAVLQWRAVFDTDLAGNTGRQWHYAYH